MFEQANPYHPESWTATERARYEASAGEPAPPRNPYRIDVCHPVRLGHPAMKDDDPWMHYPGPTMTHKCLAWLRDTFGGSHHVQDAHGVADAGRARP
jgi:hypothetical protein